MGSIAATGSNQYRFLLIQAFSLPEDSDHVLHESLHETRLRKSKESRLMDYDNVKHLLDGVEWDYRVGPLAPYGNWPVETREEFCLAAAGRLPLVREACDSGKYNGIILLGGGEPGFAEAREIARPYGIVVTSCAFSQMHIASMLGNRFSVIDISETHKMFYYDIVVRHRFAKRCASIRNIHFPLPRPSHTGGRSIRAEREKALRGEPSEMVDVAVAEAVAAIEEDGAEVIIFGCSGAFWLRPFLAQRLEALGWEIPVLDGYSCAIVLAKAMIDLGVNASGLAFPSDHPGNWRRRKVI